MGSTPPRLPGPHVAAHQGVLRRLPWPRSRSAGPGHWRPSAARTASAPSRARSTHSGSLALAGCSSAQHAMCQCGWERTSPLLSPPEWVPTARRRCLGGRSQASPQSPHTPAPTLRCSDQRPGVWTGPLSSLGGLPPPTLIKVLSLHVTTLPISRWSLLFPDLTREGVTAARSAPAWALGCGVPRAATLWPACFRWNWINGMLLGNPPGLQPRTSTA